MPTTHTPTAEQRIENEFGESAEEVLRDLSEWVDETGQRYGPITIAGALGISPTTLYALARKYDIKLKRGHFNRFKDYCWVKWGVPFDTWIRTARRQFAREEICILLNCSEDQIEHYLFAYHHDTANSYDMVSWYRGEKYRAKGEGRVRKWRL